MKVVLTSDGATIDAHDLGPLLGLDPSQVPLKMRSGEITSQSEEGAGEDTGKIRLTFWHAGKRLRIICDSDGTVLKTIRSDARRQN